MFNEGAKLSRRQLLVRGAAVGGSLLLAPALSACNTDTSAQYTIYSDPVLPVAQKIDQVRAATAGHKGPDYRQVAADSTEMWTPGMAEVVQLGETPYLRRIMEHYGETKAELRLVQPHLLRAEDQHLYRGFIVDDKGNIIRITNTATDRAENVFAGDRINADSRRLAVVKIQIEVPSGQDALAIAQRGLELHLETVDAEDPRHPHYAYQSSKLAPLQP